MTNSPTLIATTSTDGILQETVSRMAAPVLPRADVVLLWSLAIQRRWQFPALARP
jgi:hypothetical protein